ncbi:hypothetical protein BH10PSE3_BH10PSE3_07950 [soil metagenome]
MRWLETFKQDRVVRRLARRVPPALRAGWGGSKVYTVGQIAEVLKDLKLERPYALTAYAAFLAREDFEAQVGDDATMTYDEARTLFFLHVPGSGGTYAHDPIANDDAARSGLY